MLRHLPTALGIASGRMSTLGASQTTSLNAACATPLGLSPDRTSNFLSAENVVHRLAAH
jgi:hypothetical protein